MHAPHYRLIDPPEGSLPHLPGAKVIEYHPEWSDATGRVPAQRVGYVAPEPGAPGQFRHWRPSEPPVERLFRPVSASQHAAVQFLLPPSQFPSTCVRCGEGEPVGDAQAFEQPGSHYPYDGELDDHCEDCLEAGQIDLGDAHEEERAADIAARRVD
jgi:hypothetical protein